jgi:tRNA (guanine-N7-)-methyltransferase
MRHRRVKNLEKRIAERGFYLIDSARENMGGWAGVFGNKNDLYFEIGSGKGNFLLKQASANSDRNYIGAEGNTSVIFRALEKAAAVDIKNVRFICEFINDPCEMFAKNEVSGIYLNFSDPWPKKRQAGKRLTHRGYLAAYHKILKPGGFIEVKTDSGNFFDFTLDEAAESGLFEVSEITRDLAGSDFSAKDVTTEYEEKFIAAGEKIKYTRLIKLRI